jgi:hypothetical protein
MSGLGFAFSLKLSANSVGVSAPFLKGSRRDLSSTRQSHNKQIYVFSCRYLGVCR